MTIVLLLGFAGIGAFVYYILVLLVRLTRTRSRVGSDPLAWIEKISGHAVDRQSEVALLWVAGQVGGRPVINIRWCVVVATREVFVAQTPVPWSRGPSVVVLNRTETGPLRASKSGVVSASDAQTTELWSTPRSELPDMLLSLGWGAAPSASVTLIADRPSERDRPKVPFMGTPSREPGGHRAGRRTPIIASSVDRGLPS